MANTVYEYRHKDTTGIYQLDGNQQVYIEPWEVDQIIKEGKKEEVYFFHNNLSFSDSHGAAEGRSNVRTWLKWFKKKSGYRRITRGFGYEAIAVDLLCSDQEMIQSLIALDGYPLLDDQDWSKMQLELFKTAWKDYLKDNFLDALAEKFGSFSNTPASSKLKALLDQLLQQPSQEFVIQRGGDVYIDFKSLLRNLPEAPTFLRLDNRQLTA
jgi:hypothetical protein